MTFQPADLSPPGARRDLRRAMILDAAAQQFLAHGYRRTGISDVADAARVAKGTIYLHVRSKDDLFEAALQHLINGFLEKGRVALHGPGSMVRQLTRYLDEVVGTPGRMVTANPYGADMLEIRHGRTAPLLRRFELAIHRDVHAVLVADRYPVGAGEFVVAAAHGHKRSWRDAESFRSRLEKHLHFLLTGLKL